MLLISNLFTLNQTLISFSVHQSKCDNNNHLVLHICAHLYNTHMIKVIFLAVEFLSARPRLVGGSNALLRSSQGTADERHSQCFNNGRHISAGQVRMPETNFLHFGMEFAFVQWATAVVSVLTASNYHHFTWLKGGFKTATGSFYELHRIKCLEINDFDCLRRV